MKKRLLTLLILCFCFASTSYAGNEATLGIHINDPVKTNAYFLCIYDVGCMSIKAGDKGKTFPMPAENVSNVLELVITDIRTMQEFDVPTNTSCHINVHSDQKLTVSGKLIVQNGKPTIKNLDCHLA